jgi:ribose 5-phosphate isomerase B
MEETKRFGIVIGSDHGGYELKEEIKKLLDEKGIKYEDVGTFSEESVDYPDYAAKVSEIVSSSEGKRRGILICGTGIGMSMVANKFPKIRAALCHDEYTARMAREHNDANILCMGGRVLDKGTAKKITEAWLETPFSEEERHKRRIEKINSSGCH